MVKINWVNVPCIWNSIGDSTQIVDTETLKEVAQIQNSEAMG